MHKYERIVCSVFLAAVAVPAGLSAAGEQFDVPDAPFTFPAGKKLTILFNVTVDPALPHGLTVLSNQGDVAIGNFPDLKTGDPDETNLAPGDPEDATITGAINNTPPVLDISASPASDSIDEDIPDGINTGITVADLLSRTGPLTGDGDGDPLGIAVTAVSNADGVWEYDENGGAAWTAFGAPADADARLLAHTATVRFNPNPDFFSTLGLEPNLTFRAWDQVNTVSHVNGSTGDASVNGGNSPTASFSAESETATIAVNAIAETPSVTPAATNEDILSTSDLVITPDAADLGGVTHFRIDNIAGGQLFLGGGGAEINGGDFITTAQGGAGLEFLPAPQQNNTTLPGGFSFEAEASIDGIGSGLSGIATGTISVAPVNDRPTFEVPTPVIDGVTSGGVVTISGFVQNILPGPGAATDEGFNLGMFILTETSNLISPPLVPAPSVDFGSGDLSYTAPAVQSTGQATYDLVLNDGEGMANGGSEESFPQQISITFNFPPTIDPSPLPDQNATAGISLSPIPFMVDDLESPVDTLTLRGSSSNQSVLPDGNISFSGSAADRLMFMIPVSDGAIVVTVRVMDPDGGFRDEPFNLTVAPAPDLRILRDLPRFYITEFPFMVKLTVIPAPGTGDYTITEDVPDLPVDWALQGVSDGGSALGNTVSYNLNGEANRRLTYVVTPPAAAVAVHAFAGEGNAGGGPLPTVGDTTIAPIPMLGYSDWAELFGVGLKTADESGDQITNFESYAFGFDPTRNNSNRVPMAVMDGGDLVMTYRQAKYAADVQYSIEQSEDDTIFSALADPQQTIVGEDSSAFLVEVRAPVVAEVMFLRVSVIDLAP